MRLLKSLSLSAFSMGVRFAAALLAFSVVARVLGPSRFGVLMLCLSIASLLALVSNFGLVVLLLREIGRDASAAPAILGRTLSAKLLVTTVALLIGAGIFPLLAPEARWVAESHPHEGVEVHDDGTLELILPVSSPTWVAGLLLRLGPLATVLDAGGLDLDALRSGLADRVLSRYDR